MYIFDGDGDGAKNVLFVFLFIRLYALSVDTINFGIEVNIWNDQI